MHGRGSGRSEDRPDQGATNESRIAETRALVEGDASGALPLAEEVLERLARAGRFRDEETAEHVERMSRTCALIARSLGWDTDRCVDLRVAATMHDLGKIGIPDSVLKKPGALSAGERALIERHPQIGHDILAGSEDPVLDLGAKIALTHHERVDGEGYPQGLSGNDIPIEGRIAAVADVFDALTHERIYRSAFSVDEAVEMLRDGRGTQFDADILDAFEAALPEIDEIRRRYPDSREEPEPVEAGEDGPLRVLIVDDHEAVARGLELLLRREGLEIAGSARSLHEARGMLERRAVDVAVLDIHLGDGSGLELIPAAKAQGARCLAYTGLVDNEAVDQARAAGADGLAAKAGSPRELSAAVKTVAAGDSYFDQRFDAGEPGERKRALTPREAEVVGLLAEGLTGEEIAERLFLSPATVRTHIRNAMDRLGARTRAHLVTLADRRR